MYTLYKSNLLWFHGRTTHQDENNIPIGILVSNNSSNKVVTFWWPGSEAYKKNGLELDKEDKREYKQDIKEIEPFKKQFETVENAIFYLLKTEFAEFL